MALVYQATNLRNGKRYIGVTKGGLSQRRYGHHHEARQGSKKPFQRAIAKYGESAFAWDILERHEDYTDALAAEVRLIASLKPEYNVTKGGQGAVGRPIAPSLLVRFQSEWRAMGPKASARPVICLNDGKTYSSAVEAARVYSLAASSISAVCKDRPTRRSAGGLVFRYAGSTATAEDAMRIVMEAKASQTSKISAFGGLSKARAVRDKTTGQIFVTVKAAAQHYGIKSETVIRSAKRQKTARTGPRSIYLFEYVKETANVCP